MGYLNEDGLATLVGKVKGQVVQLTAAEYRQIPAETKNTDNKIYFVEDDDYAYAIDNEPTLNSENLVKSGGVYNYTSKIGTGALTTTAQTLIPAVNELKADIATLNSGYIGDSFNVAVQASTDTTIGSITLPSAGLWLIIAVVSLNASVNATYLLTVGSRTVRGNGLNGGGMINSFLHQASGSETINILGYISQACTYRVTIQAIKLR